MAQLDAAIAKLHVGRDDGYEVERAAKEKSPLHVLVVRAAPIEPSAKTHTPAKSSRRLEWMSVSS